MKIGMIQNEVNPNTQVNIDCVYTLSKQVANADVLVLPEMWTVPYANEAMKASAQYMDVACACLKRISQENHQLVIGGTIVEKEGSHLYNTCFIYRDGHFVAKYRKMHLMEFHAKKDYAEKDIFTPGDSIVTFDQMGVCVCYDIRFPELARLLTIKGAQILFVPSAFNTRVGELHWAPILQTRAMENQIFVCGVNPAHYSYQGYEAYGHSMIVDPFGRIVDEMDGSEGVRMVEIDMSQIDKIRNRMPFWDVRRSDVYELKEK